MRGIRGRARLQRSIVRKTFPGVQTKILLDDDSGSNKTGVGELCIKSPSLEITRGTNADIMKVGGYKLSALEIEAVLLEHPAISECCVLGLPDKDW